MTVRTVITSSVPGATPKKAILTVLRGPEVGRVLTLPVGQVITFGRADDCTYRFEESGMSRVHARVMSIGGQFIVSDAGSTNGTFVNDQRISSPEPLRGGERVQFGTSLTLNFLLVDEAEEEALRRVHETSQRDGLTGVFNRRYLDERLEAEVAFALRHRTVLSVGILDVDFFKKVNDTRGHLAGDAVLRHLGALLRQSIRTEDVVGRYGGEEFVLVLRGIDRHGAWQLADRLRQTVAGQDIPCEGGSLRVTLSAGVADLTETGEPATRDSLLKLADTRLYDAKQGGRNRVV